MMKLRSAQKWTQFIPTRLLLSVAMCNCLSPSFYRYHMVYIMPKFPPALSENLNNIERELTSVMVEVSFSEGYLLQLNLLRSAFSSFKKSWSCWLVTRYYIQTLNVFEIWNTFVGVGRGYHIASNNMSWFQAIAVFPLWNPVQEPAAEAEAVSNRADTCCMLTRPRSQPARLPSAFSTQTFR
jgi:hypothetical protein